MILQRLCNYFAACVQLDEFIRRGRMGISFLLHRRGPVEWPVFSEPGATSCAQRRRMSGLPSRAGASFGVVATFSASAGLNTRGNRFGWYRALPGVILGREGSVRRDGAPCGLCRSCRRLRWRGLLPSVRRSPGRTRTRGWGGVATVGDAMEGATGAPRSSRRSAIRSAWFRAHHHRGRNVAETHLLRRTLVPLGPTLLSSYLPDGDPQRAQAATLRAEKATLSVELALAEIGARPTRLTHG
jgi:hypothetical protein